MIITGTDTNNNVQEVNVDNNQLIVGSLFHDLGQVITATNMPAGAMICSDWYNNVQWVRNIRCLASSDQQYDIYIYVGDTFGISNNGNGITIVTAQASTATDSYRSHFGNNSTGVFGYSVKFGIKNSSASVNTFANLRIQLMGS